MRFIFIFSLIIPVSLLAQINKDCQKAKGFNHIMVYDGIVASIEQGEEDSVCAGSSTKLDRLDISIADSVLRIQKRTGNRYENQPRIRIICKHLSTIEGLGKAELVTRDILTDSLTIILKSGSTLYTQVEVKTLKADITEGALLSVKGTAHEQIIDVALKATYSGYETTGEKGTISVGSGGVAKVNIKKEINATASMGGQVRYKGNPIIDAKANFGGKVISDD